MKNYKKLILIVIIISALIIIVVMNKDSNIEERSSIDIEHINALQDNLKILQDENMKLKESIEVLNQEKEKLSNQELKESNILVILDQKTIDNLIFNAVEMYQLFYINSIAYDFKESITRNDTKYYKVIDNKYNKLETLEELLSDIFSKKIVDSLITTNKYIMFNDHLYTQGGEMGSMLDWKSYTLDLLKSDSNEQIVTYLVKVPYLDGSNNYQSTNISFIYKNNEWKIEEFEFIF